MMMSYILVEYTTISVHTVILIITGIGISKIIHVDVEAINLITNTIIISNVSS